MNTDILATEAESIIKSIDIPHSPQILLDINREVITPEPNFHKIKELVSQDVSLSAKIIKVANSSYFALRYKVQSIEHALTVLGLENFTNIVLASALRDAFAQDRQLLDELDDVFNHLMVIARISQLILGKVHYSTGGIIYPNQVYMAGLFHDIGILILRKKFPNYFVEVNNAFPENKYLINIEEDKFRTNHAVVGYFMAKSWSLPDEVCHVIQHHHNLHAMESESPTVVKMLAINLLSEILFDYTFEAETGSYSVFGHQLENAALFNQLLEQLNIEREDLHDVVDKIKDMLFPVEDASQ